MLAYVANRRHCILACAVPADFGQVVDKWDLIFDTGAIYHVVGNIDLLVEIKQANRALRTAAGEDLDVMAWARRIPTLACIKIDTVKSMKLTLKYLIYCMHRNVRTICYQFICCGITRFSYLVSTASYTCLGFTIRMRMLF